jgi:hypothetical protein
MPEHDASEALSAEIADAEPEVESATEPEQPSAHDEERRGESE